MKVRGLKSIVIMFGILMTLMLALPGQGSAGTVRQSHYRNKHVVRYHRPYDRVVVHRHVYHRPTFWGTAYWPSYYAPYAAYPYPYVYTPGFSFYLGF